MASVDSRLSEAEAVLLREGWLQRLNDLVANVETWAKELDWSTRRIEKSLEDYEIGTHKAPALLLQNETVRIILDPIARSAPGTEGVVDLYVQPAYDDIASLYFVAGEWKLNYVYPNRSAVAKIRAGETRALSKESLADVLDAMLKNAV